MAARKLKKRKPKKRTVFTREIVQSICDAIGRGITEEIACQGHKVDLNSFKVTVSNCPEYRAMVDVAKAVWMVEAVKRIDNGEKNWQRIAWLLERRHWQLFARNPEILIKHDTVIQQNIQAADETGLGLTTDELAELQRTAHKLLNVEPAEAARQKHLQEAAKAIDVETVPA